MSVFQQPPSAWMAFDALLAFGSIDLVAALLSTRRE